MTTAKFLDGLTGPTRWKSEGVRSNRTTICLTFSALATSQMQELERHAEANGLSTEVTGFATLRVSGFTKFLEQE